MAIRRRVLAQVGEFRTDLDRNGTEALAAGDTEMADRIHKAGWKVVYVPDASVRHLVAPERLQKSHLYRIGRGLAASHVVLTADPRPSKIVRWFASDAWYATRMLGRLLVALAWRKHLWFDDYLGFWMVARRIPCRWEWLWRRLSLKLNDPT
jgi:GT2 family glycosyltransferase